MIFTLHFKAFKHIFVFLIPHLNLKEHFNKNHNFVYVAVYLLTLIVKIRVSGGYGHGKIYNFELIVKIRLSYPTVIA